MANFKEIWLGPVLGSNRSHLIERCADLVSQNKSDTFLYLAASQSLLEIVTKAILDGEKNRAVWGELPVYLFRGFVRRVLSTATNEEAQRLAPRVPIDRDELPLRRSLFSQILDQLLAGEQLKALAPVANREGCVNTVTTLIGEIERAAIFPEQLSEIINARTQDLTSSATSDKDGLPRQIDYDREIGLIYATYHGLLNQYGLTEDDADQLRALSVLNGIIDGRQISIPWLSNVELLVLDGFFDFTPVQGEILRRLIPQIPNVIVNLNNDARNPEIFLPFRETIAHLSASASFAERVSDERLPTCGALEKLPENLFNPSISGDTGENTQLAQSEIRYFECGDRDTEVRATAREIKRLLVFEGYNLSEIAFVVRQRASYGDTIARVMREESVPCNLERRIEARDIPGNRAALKLFSILEELCRDESSDPRVSELADLVKSEYFRFGAEDLQGLWSRFVVEFGDLLGFKEGHSKHEERLKRRYRLGMWDADALENAFAYVGSDLRVTDWLNRARILIKELPTATETKQLLNIDGAEHDREPDLSDQIENAETLKLEEKDVERKRRPSRDVHPATIAWTALVLQLLTDKIQSVPLHGPPAELRHALMRLLDQLCFPDQITTPIRRITDDEDLPQIMLNFNSLESLRRAFVATIKSLEITASLLSADGKPAIVALDTFIDEVRRSLGSQSHVLGTADRGGLRVLEVTDVRGLRFRAIFIAGLVEGGFPLRASRDWIYPHEERERLKQYGLTLEDISPATLLKEEHYFYQAACRATERLYLTRPLVLEDDSETVPSYYIDELRRAIAPFALEAEITRRDYDGKELSDVSTARDLNVALVRQQERHSSSKGSLIPTERVESLLTLSRSEGFLSDSALRRLEIERERDGYLFGPYDGLVTDQRLLALLNQRFGSDFVHSASGLSVYGNCGYRFFAQRILKLEPRGEAALDLQAIDAGKLLHDILRRFFERHRRERLYELERVALQQELAQIADSVFDEHERVVPPLNRQIWKIDREIRKILLDQVLLYELGIQEEASNEDVLPAYFEVGFGALRSAARDPHSIDQALELTRSTSESEETMSISGQIDRVDLARDNTIIAYDYKLSTGSTKEDIKAGRSLQIPIYLEALEKLVLPHHLIAGGGYYVIRGTNDRRNKGLYRKEFRTYSNIHPQSAAVISDDEWQQIRQEVIAKIWSFLDRMRAGRFEVNPSEKEKTCRFCDFNAVCRYDRYRIERKKQPLSDSAH